MSARHVDYDADENGRRSYDLAIKCMRELCIRRRQIAPEVGNKLEQAWAAEGEVPSSHLHCVREER